MHTAFVYYAILALSGAGAGATAWDIGEDNSDSDMVALSLLQHDLHHETSNSSSSQHRWTTPAGFSRHSKVATSTLLPSVDCVRIISLNGSEMLGPLRNELKFRGLWSRTTVQTEQLDPEGGQAGCFRAHVRAWNFGLTQECTNLLVLEDDVFFENATVDVSIGRADAFLQSGYSYDMLFLGWNPYIFGDGTDVQVSPIDGMDCIFQMSGEVGGTHAYVISKTAMQRFSTIEYQGTPIDVELRSLNDIAMTVRPMTAFQRYHESHIPWKSTSKYSKLANKKLQDDYNRQQGSPTQKREQLENPVYETSGYGEMCAL